MDKITKIMTSTAFLLIAISIFIFVLKFDTTKSIAATIAPNGINARTSLIFTQSADGKTLYSWKWDFNRKTFSRIEYNDSFK